jgi:hypothetical protein
MCSSTVLNSFVTSVNRHQNELLINKNRKNVFTILKFVLQTNYPVINSLL